MVVFVIKYMITFFLSVNEVVSVVLSCEMLEARGRPMKCNGGAGLESF